MKKLILLSAVPGAGKSTRANEYKASHKDENVFIVASDEIRKELGGRYDYFEEEDKVWELFLNRTNNYAQTYDNVTVILDSTNLTNEYRNLYVDKTPLFDKHVLVFLNVSKAWAKVKNIDRDKNKIVPDEAMNRFFNMIELPDVQTLSKFDEYIEIKH